jgi:hypothetical protein
MPEGGREKMDGRARLGKPINEVGQSMHSEKAPRFRSKLDVAASATEWSEPVCGLEWRPLESDAFHGALLQQLSSGTKMLAYATSKMAIACFRFGLHMHSPAP